MRPPPKLSPKLKLWSTKRRRPARSAKVGKRNAAMAALRLADLTRWMDDVFGAGVELDPSTRSEDIVRIFVHHFPPLRDGTRRASEWMLTYAPWISRRDREAMISESAQCQIFLCADKLGWKLGLTDEQRTRLRITTIGAVGVSKEMRAARRRKAHAERQRRLRAAKAAAKRAHHID